MGKKNDKERKQKLKLQQKSKDSFSASKHAVATPQTTVDNPRRSDSESKTEPEYDAEQEETSGEEETSHTVRQDASAAKSATSPGSNSEGIQKAEENPDSSNVVGESLSEDEVRRRFRTKKKEKMVIPLVHSPAEAAEDEKESDEDEGDQTESNGKSKFVPKKKPSKKSRPPTDNLEVDSRAAKRARESNPFVRTWSENDEVLLLEAMVKYKSSNSSIDSSGFSRGLVSFIRETVRFGFKPSKEQVQGKISKLKAQHAKMRSQTFDPSKRKPHACVVYKLSKEYWGDLVIVTSQAKKSEETANFLDSKSVQAYYPPTKPDSWIGVGGMDLAVNEALKEGFELISQPQPWELDKHWIKLRIQACLLFVEKVNLFQKECKLNRKRLSLMKESVASTCDSLMASLSNQDGEED